MPDDAAIHRALHVVHHAAREGENLRPEVALDDFLDRGGVARRHHRHAGFNAMHAGFGQRFGDADLVVFGEDDAGLLFAVAQRDVVKLDLLREMKLIAHRALKVPGTDEPLICLPRFLRHNEFLQTNRNFNSRARSSALPDSPDSWAPARSARGPPLRRPWFANRPTILRNKNWCAA